MNPKLLLTISIAAVAVAANAKPALAADADPFVGLWILDLSKSSFVPGPGPKSETIKVEALPGGAYRSTVHEVLANGRVLMGGTTYALDGKDNPVSPAPAPGAPGFDALAFKRVDTNTMEIALKRDGKTIGKRTIAVSSDGKTKTETQDGATFDGRPLKNTWVFNRQD